MNSLEAEQEKLELDVESQTKSTEAFEGENYMFFLTWERKKY